MSGMNGSNIITTTFGRLLGRPRADETPLDATPHTANTPRNTASKGLSRRNFLKVAVGGVVAAKFGVLGVEEAMAQMGGGQHYEPPFVPAATTAADFIHPTMASANTSPVGLRLVCMFDISGSIDNTEYEVQRAAMRDAIASEDFRNAIFYRGGPQSIAICVSDFGSNADLRIPWLDIRQGEGNKLLLLANEINALNRRETGMTHQVRAMNFAGTCLNFCPWQGRRSVVDIITDGKENEFSGTTGENMLHAARERLALDQGATVNALITVDPSSSDRDLEEWAWQHLATPATYVRPDGGLLEPGFVKVVAFERFEQAQRSLVEYHRAMELAFRRKLILEVAGVELEELQGILRAQEPNPALNGIFRATPPVPNL